MSSPPRILFVADADAAADLLGAIRQGGPVEGQLAPTAEVLRSTLIDPDAAETWGAVVFLPGGPVEEVEVAVYVPDGVPLFVVGSELPLLLTETAAVAIPTAELDTVLDRLPTTPGMMGTMARESERAEPEADGLASASEESAPAPDSVMGDSASESPSDAAPEFTPITTPPTSTPLAWDAPPAPSPFAFDDDAAPASASAAARPGPPATPPAGSGLFQSLDEEDWGLTPAPPLAADAESASAPETEAMPARLASLADHLPVGLYRSSPEGRVTYANPALAALLDVESVEALKALDVQADLGYPRDQFAAEIAETGSVRNLVVTWRRKDGTYVHSRENARSLYGPDGQLVGYEGTMEDVTAEVEARLEEQAVARQHRAVAAFAAAAALADEPVTIHCAAAGALLDATGAAWACLLIGGDLRLAASSGDLPTGIASAGVRLHALREAAALVPDTSADGVSDEARALAALGVRSFGAVPVRVGGEAAAVLLWGDGAPQYAVAAERRAAEALAWHVGGHLDRAAAVQALSDTQASLSAIAEHTPHVLYRLRYTPAGPHYEYISPAIERLTGYTREEVEARGGPGGLVETRDVLAGEGLASGPVPGVDTYRAVYRMATAHGIRWVENAGRPWFDASGHPVGLVGVLQDVTDRKAREDRLADAAQTALVRQRALVDLAHLEGASAFGASAAAIAASTLAASDISFWSCEAGQPCEALYAPPATVPLSAFEGAFKDVVGHVAQHRALAVANTAEDSRVEALGLETFVRAYSLDAVLIAPIRRRGQVTGMVAVHRTDGPHEWDAAEIEFAAAVADAVALALEREDRERTLEELVEAREAAEAGRAAAERMNRLKSAFLANMSHEVRTPLTGILGFAEILASEVPEDHHDVVKLIQRNGYRLLNTLNDVLDLSRLEAGEYEADPRPTRLAEAVREAAAPLAEDAEARGLRFDLALDPDVGAAVDAHALRQLVGHVVGNAVKFTDAGGVLVTLEGTEGEAVLRVADTGRGISEAFLPEVMEAFRQEDVGHARSHEGTGLGLTIARSLVHLQEGSITVESEQPGGTVVTVTFPRVDVSPLAHRPAPSRGDGVPVAARPGAAPDADRPDPSHLLGAPFDFTFLTAGPADTVPVSPPDALATRTPSPAPTDMFDFRFGRSQDADPTPEPAQKPPAPQPAAPPARPSTPPVARPMGAAPTAPAPAAPPAPAPPAGEPVMIVRAKPGQPTIPEAAPPQDAEVVQAPSNDGRPPLLVVEDNDDTRMLLERILRSTYTVTAVGDARSALLAMNQQRFSGLVLDINLGGKETGADVLRIARSLPQYDGVFAIALTAYALPGDRERLLESGFNAYISKPFTRQSLMETLAEGVKA